MAMSSARPQPNSRSSHSSPAGGVDETAWPQMRADPPSPAPHLPPARPKERRRPLLVAAMVALVCAGALISAWAFQSTSDTSSVVAVRQAVARGEVIEAQDLMTVQVGLDPALAPLPASDLNGLIGQRAAVDLSAGSLITAQSATEQVRPVEGQSIVGVSFTSAMMPSEPLYAGDAVRIVSTPGEAGEVREDVEPIAVEATVVGLREVAETGETVVDVAVPADLAADLASRAATRKVALVLDSRER